MDGAVAREQRRQCVSAPQHLSACAFVSLWDLVIQGTSSLLQEVWWEMQVRAVSSISSQLSLRDSFCPQSLLLSWQCMGVERGRRPCRGTYTESSLLTHSDHV